jgi:TDG/mug DNA glycosylase family protein
VALREKLLRFAPRSVCFVGKVGFQAVSGRRRVNFGRHEETIGEAVVFVMPSTSGRANRFHAERLACLAEIREFLGR